jgi:hypothetical protein
VKAKQIFHSFLFHISITLLNTVLKDVQKIILILLLIVFDIEIMALFEINSKGNVAIFQINVEQ